MKTVIFFLIDIYHIMLSPLLKSMLGTNKFCRYNPTCSEYAKKAIEKYGVMRGSVMALVRILSCQPFTKRSSYA